MVLHDNALALISAQKQRPGSHVVEGWSFDSGPCILFAVVESARRTRQTGSGPGPPIEKTAKKSKGRRALLFGREPEQLPGPLRKRDEGSPNLQGRAKPKGTRREFNWTP